MRIFSTRFFPTRFGTCFTIISALACHQLAHAQSGNFVPGSGVLLEKVGDDFEDPEWDYIFNEPKSTEEQNERQNLPLGKSKNGRWYEGAKRGQPDIVRRVDTPAGGLPGSEGALMLKSLKTGIPGQPSFKMQQEDFILNVQYRTGGSVSVSENPSVTTRVFIPPTDQWERRSGPHFAFRVALETTKQTPRKVFFLTSKEEDEVYWPGLFVCMDTKEQTRSKQDQIYFRVRSNGQGGDIKGPDITTVGWWTLGISMSANGAVHYYARPGIEELSNEDYITTQFPYNYKAKTFRSAFFNVVNADNGKSWTTTWIVDDTFVFLGNGPSQFAKRARSDSGARIARQPKPPVDLPASPKFGATKSGDSKPGSSVSISDSDSAYYR